VRGNNCANSSVDGGQPSQRKKLRMRDSRGVRETMQALLAREPETDAKPDKSK